MEEILKFTGSKAGDGWERMLSEERVMSFWHRRLREGRQLSSMSG